MMEEIKITSFEFDTYIVRYDCGYYFNVVLRINYDDNTCSYVEITSDEAEDVQLQELKEHFEEMKNMYNCNISLTADNIGKFFECLKNLDINEKK